MSQKFPLNSLVLYKSRPAKVVEIGEKITIDTPGGSKRVREKDIVVLHPGPVSEMPSGSQPAPLLDETRELLLEESVGFEDFVELLYDDYSPTAAWNAWQLLNEGLYFSGELESIQARPDDLVQAEIAELEKKARDKAQWEELLERIRRRKLEEADRQSLVEVERVAHAQSDRSRILDALEITVSPQNAHRLLVDLGHWRPDYNPHPQRFGVELGDNLLSVPASRLVTRTDLTGMPAWAIDDAGSDDPDDAISADGDRLYVHVADAASIVTPDSELDTEARARGANLYLPDRIVPMLPHGVTQVLGLGLAEGDNPALTVSFAVDADGEIGDIRVEATTVNVTRTTYEAADEDLDTTFAGIKRLTDRIGQRRERAGAASINLPEVNVRVLDEVIAITPYQRGGSRQLVTEAMLAAGEAVGRFALDNAIPIPYAIQHPPDEIRQPVTISEMFAYRRLFKPSSGSLEAGPHFGLGLPAYTRFTSPLRRYLDLVVHQQLHAWLRGEPLLDPEQLGERVAVSQTSSAAIRKSERFSNQFWKLVYLQRNPKWEGEAVIAELDERKMTLIVPELALETRQRRVPGLELDQTVSISVSAIDLADLSVRFRIFT